MPMPTIVFSGETRRGVVKFLPHLMSRTLNQFNPMIGIDFTHHERELLLKYGYPFPRLNETLKANRSNRGTCRITTSDMEWEQLAGNLSISINEDIQGERLVWELDELADRAETALRHR